MNIYLHLAHSFSDKPTLLDDDQAQFAQSESGHSDPASYGTLETIPATGSGCLEPGIPYTHLNQMFQDSQDDYDSGNIWGHKCSVFSRQQTSTSSQHSASQVPQTRLNSDGIDEPEGDDVFDVFAEDDDRGNCKILQQAMSDSGSIARQDKTSKGIDFLRDCDRVGGKEIEGDCQNVLSV